MTPNNKPGAVFDCGYDSEGWPDPAGAQAAEQQLFEIIKNARLIPEKGRLLDIGSGLEGTEIVNRCGREFPGLNTTYLDSALFLLKELDKNNKVCANAVKMPFQDDTFDAAYAGAIIASGVLKNCQFFKNQSYLLAKEAYRVLKPDCWFLFTYCTSNSIQKSQKNLSEIGFRELMHVQRVFWHDLPQDVYAVKK